MDTLDEKGFIFLDNLNRPYKCCLIENQPWLLYWHPDNKWVTLRPVTQTEIWRFPKNLTKEQHMYDTIDVSKE